MKTVTFFGYDFTLCTFIPDGEQIRKPGVLAHNHLPVEERDFILDCSLPTSDGDAMLKILGSEDYAVNDTIIY